MYGIWHKSLSMDGLESTTQTPVATPSVSTTASVSATPVAPIQDTVPSVPASTSSTPTKSDGDIKAILKNLNWYEVGFGILASATLYYTIYYYKYHIYLNKKVIVDMQNKIDELTIKMSDLESVENEQSPNNVTQKKLDIFK